MGHGHEGDTHNGFEALALTLVLQGVCGGHCSLGLHNSKPVRPGSAPGPLLAHWLFSQAWEEGGEERS